MPIHVAQPTVGSPWGEQTDARFPRSKEGAQKSLETVATTLNKQMLTEILCKHESLGFFVCKDYCIRDLFGIASTENRWASNLYSPPVEDDATTVQHAQ